MSAGHLKTNKVLWFLGTCLIFNLASMPFRSCAGKSIRGVSYPATHMVHVHSIAREHQLALDETLVDSLYLCSSHIYHM